MNQLGYSSEGYVELVTQVIQGSDIVVHDEIYVDDIKEKTSGHGVEIDSLHIKDNDITNMPILNSSGGSLNSLLKYTQSSGVLSGFTITDLGTGSIDVSSGTCLVRINSDDDSEIKVYNVAAVSAMPLTDLTETIIIVEYNAGTPQIAKRETLFSDVWDNSNSEFMLYHIRRDGLTLHITHHISYINNPIVRLNRFLHDKNKLTQTSGLVIGETGTRNVTMTSGRLYVSLQHIDLSAIDTSLTDTFSTYYYNFATTAWVETTLQTQWPNTHYDDLTAGLVEMTVNRYSFIEFFIHTDGDMVAVYGQNQYTNIAETEGASILTNLPNNLGSHSLYLGRYIFKKSSATATSVLSAFTSSLTYQSANDHSNLANLSNDDHTQYTTLSNRTGETLLIDNIDIGEQVKTSTLTKLGITGTTTSNNLPNMSFYLSDDLARPNFQMSSITSLNNGIYFNCYLGPSGNTIKSTASDSSLIMYKDTRYLYYYTSSGDIAGDIISPSISLRYDCISGDLLQQNDIILRGQLVNDTGNVQINDILQVDNITELTTDSGVTIESVLLRDGNIKSITNAMYFGVYDLTADSTLYFYNSSASSYITNVDFENNITVNNSIIFGSTNSFSDFLDEDAMTSDSATSVSSQQAIKAYVDNTVSSSTYFTKSSTIILPINNTDSIQSYKKMQVNALTTDNAHCYLYTSDEAIHPKMSVTCQYNDLHSICFGSYINSSGAYISSYLSGTNRITASGGDMTFYSDNSTAVGSTITASKILTLNNNGNTLIENYTQLGSNTNIAVKMTSISGTLPTVGNSGTVSIGSITLAKIMSFRCTCIADDGSVIQDGYTANTTYTYYAFISSTSNLTVSVHASGTQVASNAFKCIITYKE